MKVEETIKSKLEAAFSPQYIDVRDESSKHIGHSGWKEGGETHFFVAISAEKFNGLSRIERQRAVYKCLEAELQGQIHALALEIKGSNE